jgi:hypothetical protein
MKDTLTTLQKEYVELMLDDKFYTNKQMADLLGCDERTIYKMKANEKVIKEIERQADTRLTADISKAYGVLTEIIFNPETPEHARLKALDLYLKTQGKLKDKSETDVTVKATSIEQAEAELDQLLDF